MSQLPEKLMKLRRHYHVSQQQVASFCHVDLMEYMSWENGREIPDEMKYALLAELFHLSVEDMRSDSLDVPLQEVEEVEEVLVEPAVPAKPTEPEKTKEIEKTQVVTKISETVNDSEEDDNDSEQDFHVGSCFRNFHRFLFS